MMTTTTIQEEMLKYFGELNTDEQQSVLVLIKTFVNRFQRQLLKEYNDELEEGNAEIEAGNTSPMKRSKKGSLIYQIIKKNSLPYIPAT